MLSLTGHAALMPVSRQGIIIAVECGGGKYSLRVGQEAGRGERARNNTHFSKSHLQ